MPCLRGDRQEPLVFSSCFSCRYLLVQKVDSLPLYDERFVGYGWNKVQWIEHLRYIGYRFYVFNNGFIIHCPHPESAVPLLSNHQVRVPTTVRSANEAYSARLEGVFARFEEGDETEGYSNLLTRVAFLFLCHALFVPPLLLSRTAITIPFTQDKERIWPRNALDTARTCCYREESSR